ncbi:hypothetical protein TRSC58_07215 [Trypanosoma rangeli SC58]|uniref:Uncharacterized protein n=1 Tax=Trypanosoma rangeli SC58 TaxID=429131 RepID=A0A061IT99_TRYRA|nr:hypothetical protein TRSC58_07215 [Trypanosoma rangeli SC58]
MSLYATSATNALTPPLESGGMPETWPSHQSVSWLKWASSLSEGRPSTILSSDNTSNAAKVVANATLSPAPRCFMTLSTTNAAAYEVLCFSKGCRPRPTFTPSWRYAATPPHRRHQQPRRPAPAINVRHQHQSCKNKKQPGSSAKKKKEPSYEWAALRPNVFNGSPPPLSPIVVLRTTTRSNAYSRRGPMSALKISGLQNVSGEQTSSADSQYILLPELLEGEIKTTAALPI